MQMLQPLSPTPTGFFVVAAISSGATSGTFQLTFTFEDIGVTSPDEVDPGIAVGTPSTLLKNPTSLTVTGSSTAPLTLTQGTGEASLLLAIHYPRHGRVAQVVHGGQTAGMLRAPAESGLEFSPEVLNVGMAQ